MLLPVITAAIASTPMLMLAAECLAACASHSRVPDRGATPPFTVLMPAHDEAAGIGPVIAAAKAQLRSCDQLIVVADNCTDTTAAIAREAGATIVERVDPSRRGKAYALDFGRACLMHAPPSVVIVLDADCVAAPGALQLLAAAADANRAVVQALYQLEIQPDSGPIERASAFAFMIRNFVRQRGLQRLSGRAMLQGTGMAFPWSTFESAPLISSSLVEDLQLGLDLFLAGERVIFDEAALITSPASDRNATMVQRTRWEHGHLSTAASYVPRLGLAFLRGRLRALPLAMDLMIPPLSLLVVIAAASLAMLGVIGWSTGDPAPFLVTSAAGLLAASALFLAWFRWGRDLLPWADLRRMPQYLAWKMPVYGRFFTRRQRSWVRTARPR